MEPTSMKIMQRQKQALIDNLQLEITERARKLRAQYALQAQGLKTRLELRVNRIPSSLRATTMGELLEKCEAAKAQQTAAANKQPPSKTTAKSVAANTAKTRAARSPAPVPRGMKRTSEVMDEEDKENTPDPSHDVANPKKRSKVSATGGRRAANASTVLSPKSSNSRTIPQTPIRPPLGAASKSATGRPASPLKAAAAAATSTLASMVGEKSRSTRATATTANGRKTTTKTTTMAAATKAKKATASAPGERAVSSSSNTSGTSTGTTIVKKVGRALNTATKKASSTTAANKKAPTTKPATGTAAATAKRTLRKRV